MAHRGAGQYYNMNPVLLDEEQVLDYLHYLKQQKKTPSESFFKHTVYGLRYAYRMEGMKAKRIVLPSLERPKTLPVVLSKEDRTADADAKPADGS